MRPMAEETPCYTPVINSKDWAAGLLVPQGNPTFLTTVSLRLIGDGELRRPLSTATRQRFGRKSDIPVPCEMLFAIFPPKAARSPG